MPLYTGLPAGSQAGTMEWRFVFNAETQRGEATTKKGKEDGPRISRMDADLGNLKSAFIREIRGQFLRRNREESLQENKILRDSTAEARRTQRRMRGNHGSVGRIA